jgi:glucose-6-phosphate dehydrogenase assembly protein OpcA
MTTTLNVDHARYEAEHVPLSDLEPALDRLWGEANENAVAASGLHVSRNTALTLVVYCTSAEQSPAALAASEEATTQHPARTIVLVPEPAQQGSQLDASIAVHRQGAGSTAAYGEEITIYARGDAAGHIPGVVLPLMVTGLPTYLWWLGDVPWGSALLDNLVDGSDRLIIDSCDFTDSNRALGAAADLMRRKYTRCALSDFNWTRQAPWHELVAQFFDPANLRPYLSGVDRVTVEYAAGEEDTPTNDTQAYLFVGWLASRLGWSLPTGYRRGFGPARQHALHDEAGRPVLVEISARFGMQTGSWSENEQRQRLRHTGADTGPPDRQAAHAPGDGHAPSSAGASRGVIGSGALMSVRLHALAEGRPGIFIVARDEDLEHATTLCQVDAGAQPSHTVHLPSLGESALLHSQLELTGHEAIYEEALATAARLAGYDVRRGIQP